MQEIHYSYRFEYENFNPRSSLMMSSPIKIFGIIEHLPYRLLKVHNHFEYSHIWYVRSGNTLIVINDKQRYACANQFIFIPPQTYHGLEVEKNSRIFDLKFIAPPNYIPPTKVIEDKTFLFDKYGMAPLIDEMVREVSEKNDGWQTLVNAYACQLIVEALRAYNVKGSKTSRRLNRENTNSSTQDLAKEIEAFINGNFSETITLCQLGQIFNYNPCYLSSVFKKARGISITQAINETRIRHAQLKLRSKSLTVEQVARSVGYQNPSYFTKLFKEMVGMTPTKFRDEMLK